MPAPRTTIGTLVNGSPEHELCAVWRHAAFLKEDGYGVADSYDQLTKITTSGDDLEVALVARAGEELAGICLLVREELEPAHDLTPWLASLFVAPAFRRRGVATALIKAIEDHARAQGVARLHLHTVDAEALYLSCGWTLRETVTSHGYELKLMDKDL